MKEKGKEISKGSLRNLMEEKDSDRKVWILIEHQEKKRVEQARRGQRKKRMKESSGRKTLRLV